MTDRRSFSYLEAGLRLGVPLLTGLFLGSISSEETLGRDAALSMLLPVAGNGIASYSMSKLGVKEDPIKACSYVGASSWSGLAGYGLGYIFL